MQRIGLATVEFTMEMTMDQVVTQFMGQRESNAALRFNRLVVNNSPASLAWLIGVQIEQCPLEFRIEFLSLHNDGLAGVVRTGNLWNQVLNVYRISRTSMDRMHPVEHSAQTSSPWNRS